MGKKDLILGVDLGGTKLLAAVFDGEGRALSQVKAKTPLGENEDAIAKAIASLANQAAAEAGADVRELRALGVAVPSPIDRATGTIIQSPNLGFKDYPMGRRLASLLPLRAVLNNDAVSGTWGEYRAGAGRGFKSMVGVFIGTGVGGGIVIDGKLLRGAHGHAGEIGHMILMEGGAACGCGQYGCLEALSSRTAIAKEAVAAAASGKSPGLIKDAGTDFRKYRSGVLEAALKRRDPAVVRAVDRSAFWTGVGLANLANVLDPEAIVLGGGLISRLGEAYLKRAAESMSAHLLSGIAKDVRILRSALGDLAVAAGAAILAVEEGAA
jgi:glucokinase